ncbi:MAG: hypothetical protein ACMUIG_04275 [Thermoplasmatota archaeon]
MRTAAPICICSVILLSIICGCTDNGETETEVEPKSMMLDFLFYLNSGDYSKAVSMLITSDGEWIDDSADDIPEILDYLVDTYGSSGEKITIHMTSILREKMSNITTNPPFTLFHYDVRLMVPMSYSWGEDQGIIGIDVVHFLETDRWGILADIDDVTGSLAVIPLNPQEGDMEITVAPKRSEYPAGIDSIPLSITIENVCGHPLVVEYPMRIGLSHFIEASNGSGIIEVNDYLDRDIDYMIFEIGGSWTYDFDIGAADHEFISNGAPFSWDIPDEYSVIFTHYSYGLDSVVFESDEIIIEITSEGR